MMTLEILGLVASGFVVIVFVFVVVPKLVLGLLKGPLETRIGQQYVHDEILMKDLAANSFGVESRGVWQGRGNGGLVLTKDNLHFFRFVRGGDLRVSLGAITDLSLTNSHLGKSTIFDLLKVRFSVDGTTDSIALYLTDPTAWKNRIEELKEGMAAEETQ